ncbi:MAG: membrane protein insertion efficiency factor YidD [Cyanobacteria bacterium RM1_2_2]|nr:membrane protein insertion efficiency factor YidD [Cyanobacteria bacterium RM1_2_2]
MVVMQPPCRFHPTCSSAPINRFQSYGLSLPNQLSV